MEPPSGGCGGKIKKTGEMQSAPQGREEEGISGRRNWTNQVKLDQCGNAAGSGQHSGKYTSGDYVR